MNRARLKPLYLFAVALNAVALAYAVDARDPLLGITFLLVLAYIAYRYRTLPDD